MSNPFRGTDTAADLISTENLSDFRIFMRDKMPTLLDNFAEIDRIAEAGDEALFEERFGHLMRPRPAPGGRCVLTPENSPSSPLCAMCQGMFVETIEMDTSWYLSVHERYAHYATLEELHRAVTDGCPLCAMLWAHIAADYRIKFDPNLAYTELWNIRMPMLSFDYISYSISTTSGGGDSGYVLHFVYGGNTSERYDEMHTLQLGVVPVTDDRYSFYQGEVSPSTGSDSALDFAARCIRKCKESHVTCPRDSSNPWRPTRLIDLGPPGTPINPRLITTENHVDPIPCYATLSHRWNGANIFQLKGDNLDALQQTIPTDQLSKTFQEAFEASKNLGSRYIWIDSLCIVQDSHDDWEKEAARMKDVYSNAKFNISATGAENGGEGLFFDRGSLAVVPFTLEVSQTGNPTAWKPGRYRLVKPSLWSSNISQAPLNQRGWVLQERVLAKRIVHFCRDQVFFECSQLDACEMFPDGLPETDLFRKRALGTASNANFKRLDPELDGGWLREIKSMGRLKSSPAFNRYSLWAELVETYSATSLTKWEDKLVAFSGIAKMAQQWPEMAGDGYFAGLWRQHLPYHMLWSRRKDGGLLTEPMTYIAPSWSWASVQAPVTLHPVTDGANEEILISILEAETYTSSEDATGSVFGGYIKLRGFLRDAELAIWQFDHDPNLRSSMDRMRLSMEPRGPPADIIVWADERDKTPLEKPEENRNKVSCLPIQVWQNDKGDRCTEGLILEKVDFGPSVFKRVGKFKIAVGANDGRRAFYTVGDDVWEDAGVSARGVMLKAEVFSIKTITL
ncbi:heterokaryon incompatibility protein-domain-containing protein, partial [Chaetomium sp. MPI-CAGE-AT-0009]